MSLPEVSVIIPNYNQGHYVSDAIQSVLDQTFRSFEIIVVDDGSTDNSQEVIARFGDQVRYIWQENRGLSGARNTGIRAAKGQWIGLLDADDLWLPTFLETMMEISKRHAEAVVFYANASYINEEGIELRQNTGAKFPPEDAFYETLLRANFLIPSTILIHKPTIMEAGLFDENYRACEDWDLWLRLAPHHRFIGTFTLLVCYRLHASSLSADPTRMQKAVQSVVEKHFGADDGKPQNWTKEKRIAFGSIYRYRVMTSIQRQQNWQVATENLCRALQIDPTLATDLDLFYDLALGSQPLGYRGSGQHLKLNDNAAHIESMLAEVFAAPELDAIRRTTYGTAYYALGLVAYNTGDLNAAQRFLGKALWHRADLWREPQLTRTWAKSLAGPHMLHWLRGFSPSRTTQL